MFPIRDIDDDGVYFMMCHLEKLDEFMNLIVTGKIRAIDAVLFIWMASFAWKDKSGKRRPCMKSIPQMAEYLGLDEQGVQQRLKKLREAGLIRSQYRVRSKLGEVTFLDSERKSWKYRDDNGGTIIHSFQDILDETFVVNTKKKKSDSKEADEKFTYDDDDDDLYDRRVMH